jgi:hypothetical protein
MSQTDDENALLKYAAFSGEATFHIPQGYFFQQDGAPPHYANIVTDFLNGQFPNTWI